MSEAHQWASLSDRPERYLRSNYDCHTVMTRILIQHFKDTVLLSVFLPWWSGKVKDDEVSLVGAIHDDLIQPHSVVHSLNITHRSTRNYSQSKMTFVWPNPLTPSSALWSILELHIVFKGLGTFSTTQNTNFHRFTLNWNSFTIMMVESFNKNITWLLRSFLRNFCLMKTLLCDFHFFLKNWLMKLKLLQVNMTYIFIHSE